MSKYLPMLAIFLLCSGCRQDMQKQPKYMPLSRTLFFPDGRSARPIPDGTIAIDEINNDTPVATGAFGGEFLTTIPIPVTVELLQRGRERYNIYCAPCHSPTGDGNGMIARRGFKQPANLHNEHVKKAPPGYLYAVIVRGSRAMPAYAYQIKSVRDRWAIVAYIRALQLSRSARVSDVPPAEMQRLESKQ